MAIFVFFVFLMAAASARSEWHLMHPTKSDHTLRAIWGTSSDNVFAAGARGVILRYGGVRWQRMHAGTTRQIRDLHGIDGSNVFAAGFEGAMLHYDGSMWSDISGPATNGITHHGVWAYSATDVFAVGEGGSIVHYDGDQWTKMASPTTNTLHCVWGTSRDNVYAGGAQSVLLHYDGTEWSPVETGFVMKHTIKDLWGDAANNIHGVGGSQEEKAYHIHYDGSQWKERLFDNAESTLQAVWGNGPDDVWAAGGNGRIHRWDGTSWTSYTRRAFCIHGLWGSSPSDIFAVGDSGSISRFDGVKWNDMAKREHNLQASCAVSKEANGPSNMKTTPYISMPFGRRLPPVSTLSATADIWVISTETFWNPLISTPRSILSISGERPRTISGSWARGSNTASLSARARTAGRRWRRGIDSTAYGEAHLPMCTRALTSTRINPATIPITTT